MLQSGCIVGVSSVHYGMLRDVLMVSDQICKAASQEISQAVLNKTPSMKLHCYTVFLSLIWQIVGNSINTPDKSASTDHIRKDRTVLALFWFDIFVHIGH